MSISDSADALNKLHNLYTQLTSHRTEDVWILIEKQVNSIFKKSMVGFGVYGILLS